MTESRKLTQPEMVLIALYRASQGSTQKVPYEELVLQAWRDYPEAFSLRNYPQYPDGSDIHKKLYNGFLKTDSLVLSLGDKNFRLTDEGVSRAKQLIAELTGDTQTQSANGVARLSRDEERFVEQGLKSRPFNIWRNGSATKLTDYDARVFFQFSTGTSFEDRARKAALAKQAARKAIDLKVAEAESLSHLIEYFLLTFSALFNGGK